MLLIAVEETRAKRRAQELVERSVRQVLPSRGKRNIGFPSGNRDEIIYSRGTGKLWCAFGSAEDAAIPRSWNAFGVFDESRRTQMITVEVNVPTASNSASVAGFFADDPVSGATYLMHDGGVGGGKPGVGQAAFLAWSGTPLVDVEREGRAPRQGIVIGRADSRDLAARLWRYVQTVRAFKDAVAAGELDSGAMRRKVAEWEQYRRENSGRRTGRRRSGIDYISYHGDVVDLLKHEREQCLGGREKILNSPLIDLYVRSGRRMTELYEVKTSLTRQAIYTGIGQLLAHAGQDCAGVRKVLVVPEGDLPQGLADCIGMLGIAIRRFRLRSGTRPSLELL